MATTMPSEIVTKPMYDAAKKGLTGCLACREQLSVYEHLGWPVPDVKGLVDEWQPKLEALVEYYGQQRDAKSGG